MIDILLRGIVSAFLVFFLSAIYCELHRAWDWKMYTAIFLRLLSGVAVILGIFTAIWVL